MKIAKQSKHKVNGTPGSSENINMMNKNLDVGDVPVTEAANKLTAQETTELKNLVSSSRDPQVIASYLAAKSQKESLNESQEAAVARILSSKNYPRGFKWLSNNGTSGEVNFNGVDYAFRKLDDDSYKVMTSADAGWNWSETLFKDESLHEDINGFVKTRCSECGKVNRIGVYFPAYNKPFEDTKYTCSECGTENLLHDNHEYNDDGTLKEDNNAKNDNLSEASYGGAYDIEDNMYFTKEDLLEFTDELIDTLHDKGIVVDLVDMHITDGNRLVIVVEDEDGNEIDTDEFIDMRKIHLPKDIYKYKDIFIKDILSQYNEFKSLNEDLDEIPIVDRLNFINKRRNLMPGIANINEFIDCLNATGKDKFMVKETKVGSNLSLADLKDEWMTLKKKGWKWYTKNIPDNFLTYYVFEKINKSENMNEDLVEDKNSPTLFDIDKLLCVTGAQYLGAKIPPAKRHCINEINIPHNMRYKYFKTTVEDYKDTIVLNWITQEPFNAADFEVFIKEVKSAFNQIIEDINYKKPFKVAVNVDCRDENCKKTELLTFNENNITEDIQTKYKFVYSALVEIQDNFKKNVNRLILLRNKSYLPEDIKLNFDDVIQGIQEYIQDESEYFVSTIGEIKQKLSKL